MKALSGCAPPPRRIFLWPANRCRKRVDAAEPACWQRRMRCCSSCHVLRCCKHHRGEKFCASRVASSCASKGHCAFLLAKSVLRMPVLSWQMPMYAVVGCFSWHVAMAKRQKSKKKLTPVLGRTFAGPGLHYSWGGVFAWVTFQVRSPEKLFGYREIKA